MKDFKPRKFKGLIDEYGLDDFGASGQTFKVKAIEKDKIYFERDPEYLDGNEKNVVIDDNSCWHYIGTTEFEKRFKEIK